MAPPEPSIPPGPRLAQAAPCPDQKENLRSKGFDRVRRFDGFTGALDPFGTTSHPERGALPATKQVRRAHRFGRSTGAPDPYGTALRPD
jgi:hypothetical protein